MRSSTRKVFGGPRGGGDGVGGSLTEVNGLEKMGGGGGGGGGGAELVPMLGE